MKVAIGGRVENGSVKIISFKKINGQMSPGGAEYKMDWEAEVECAQTVVIPLNALFTETCREGAKLPLKSIYYFDKTENGCVFNAPSKAEHYLGDTAKQCFYNSFRRLNESPDKKYFYVEGFLRYGHFPPVQHAWLVDRAGQVWETTNHFQPPAERLLESSLYYGVPFPRETVIKLLTANGYESILHDFELDLFRKEFDVRQNLRNCFE